jgi:hypothetical protein
MMPSMAGHFVPLASLPSLAKAFRPLNLLVGLLEMVLEARDEVAIGRLIDHLGERLQDLLLRVVDVLKTVYEQVFHRFDESPMIESSEWQ